MYLSQNNTRAGIRNIFLIFFIAISLAGCSLVDIKDQTDLAGSAGVLAGSVVVKSKQKGSTVVVRFRNNSGVLVLLEKKIVSSEGKYRFNVLPGEYAIFAFIDVNNDGKFQRDKEHGNYFNNPLLYKVKANQSLTLKPLVISTNPPSPPERTEIVHNEVKMIRNTGKIVSLSDPEFSRDNYSMGMWRPIDFIDNVGGGLLMLQKYDKDKIPVIFVHGISGGPTDFQAEIDNLDLKRFQPWVLYYPSGFRLGVISDYFVQSVQLLKKRYKFKRFIIIAHSMGGVVTRSFVKKYTTEFPKSAKDIQLVMTINTPIGGMASAAIGVAISPIVVPSWRDISPDSEFFKEIYNWDWPRDIPYYLIFSYFDGDDSDGVVGLDSQIPLKLQSEATRIYGFKNNHVGTLQDEEFIKLYKLILARQTN